MTTDPWGGHAAAYDQYFTPLTGTMARALFTLTAARLPTDARILDVACGSGALLLPALEWAERQNANGGATFVVGSDFSPGMVAAAQRKARHFDASQFRCEVQNGQAMTYDDASFEAVYSCFGIFLFEDRRAGWREAARVLVPGGVFATAVWVAPELNEMFYAQFGPVVSALPDRLVAGMSPPDWLGVAEASALAAEVREAGFGDVSVQPFQTPLVLPSVEASWLAMCDNPFMEPLIRACEPDERERLRKVHAAALAPYVTPSGAVILDAVCNLLTAVRLPKTVG